MNRFAQGLAHAITDFPAESRLLGLSRTIIAAAQASILALTPAAYLFVPVGGQEITVECGRLPQSALAYCLPGGWERQTVSWVLFALLVIIASGLLPRFTAPIHFWVSLSINGAISLPDGGDAVAQVATLFIAVACLADRRWWHWSRPRSIRTGSAWQGIAWAGLWGLRLQMAYVYLNSAVTKVSVGPWQEGTATYYVTRMENFGAAGLFADVIRWSTAFPLVAVATSWGAILAEAIMAVFILGGRRRQLCALVLCCLLHLSIIVQLGIVSFGLIMIGAVGGATSRGAAEALRPAFSWVSSRRRAGSADPVPVHALRISRTASSLARDRTRAAGIDSAATRQAPGRRTRHRVDGAPLGGESPPQRRPSAARTRSQERGPSNSTVPTTRPPSVRGLARIDLGDPGADAAADVDRVGHSGAMHDG